MKLIKLKTDHKPFWDTWQGFKMHELRFNDRHYEVGDHLLLRETLYTSYEMALGTHHKPTLNFPARVEEHPLEYTGREILVKVTHVLSEADGIYGLKPGWCVLSIKMLSRISNVVGEE